MAETRDKIEGYLAAFPGDMTCAVQVWYEGLSGHGVANPEQMAEMEAILGQADGWTDAGDVRYEKFGVQKSYRRVK